MSHFFLKRKQNVGAWIHKGKVVGFRTEQGLSSRVNWEFGFYRPHEASDILSSSFDSQVNHQTLNQTEVPD